MADVALLTEAFFPASPMFNVLYPNLRLYDQILSPTKSPMVLPKYQYIIETAE